MQFIADLKAQKPGMAKNFDHQMILCEVDKLPFNRKLRSATLAIGVLEESPSIANTDQAERYYESCEEAYVVLCRGYGVALYLAGEIADLVKIVEEKQKAAKAEFTKLEDQQGGARARTQRRQGRRRLRGRPLDRHVAQARDPHDGRGTRGLQEVAGKP